MGRRSKQQKSCRALKNLMDKLTLTDSNLTTGCESDSPLDQSQSASSSTSFTKRFVLDPSHPFYWHLSNRENRPTEIKDQSSCDSQPVSQTSSSEHESSTGFDPLPKLVIRSVKHRKKKKKRVSKKSHAKTGNLTSNEHQHANANRPSSLAKANHTRRKMRRASKRQRNTLIKQRVVNTVLATGLDQLSLS